RPHRRAASGPDDRERHARRGARQPGRHRELPRQGRARARRAGEEGGIVTDEALVVTDLVTGYGQLKVVRGLSLTCRAGELTVLLGRNGAGKTTTLSAIAGLLPTMSGTVSLHGQVQTGNTVKRVKAGLGMVQEGKRIFRS